MELKLSVILFALIQLFCVKAFAIDEVDSNVIERSIGKLLISHDEKYSYQNDLNSFGSAKLFDEFYNIYEIEIKKLPKEERISFFWASMWHLDFGGHSMEQFQALVFDDCGGDYITRLEAYVAKESELKRDKSRLFLSEKVLLGLKILKARKIQ